MRFAPTSPGHKPARHMDYPMHTHPQNALTAPLRMMLSGVVFAALCAAATAQVDPARHITLDEIRTDMDAYCLTVMQGTQVEKCPLKILSIVRNYEPHRHAILVVGLDPRFIHAGTIHGCSGSPVYIDNRLAGALAAGWDGSKDPLYLVTPIEEMLTIGTAAPGHSSTSGHLQEEHTPAIEAKSDRPDSPAGALGLDFTAPIDLVAVARTLTSRTVDIRLPVATSLPAAVCTELAPYLAALGMDPIPAGAAPLTASRTDNGGYEPGGVLAIPLITGDIALAPIGTVTAVEGDTVYGLGHPFTGIGPVDLPMAAGAVHVVVPGLLQANKFATPGPVRGAVRFDEAAGIRGSIDAVAKTIPLRITVDRYNDPQTRTYDCRLAVERLRTPLVLQSAVIAAITMRGALPLEHTLAYKGAITLEGFDPITFENVSSGETYGEIGAEILGAAALLMNNPYALIDVASLDFEIDITADNTRASIRTVTIPDTRVRPGQTLTVSVLLQSYMSQLSMHTLQLPLPEDLRPGQYEITIAGAADYEKFIRKTAPYRFTAYDLPTLIQTLDDLLTIRRDRLYAVMALPVEGIAIKRSELPMLPASRATLLTDEKRTIPTQKYGRWLETSVPTQTVVLGGRTIRITVQE